MPTTTLPSASDIKGDPNTVYLLVTDWSKAVRIAGTYEHRNGAFRNVKEGFLIQWDAKPLDAPAPRRRAA